MLSKLESALALARKGFKVFPFRYEQKVAPDGTVKFEKAPNVKFVERATTDAAKIRKWWGPVIAGEPEADHEIGILTTDLLVIDFDVKFDPKTGIKKPGADDMKALIALGLPLDATSSTPTGGRHVYLRRRPEHPFLRGTIAGQQGSLGAGTDTRSFHNFVAAPGSDGYDGMPPYKWCVGSEPGSLDDIPFAPDWLVDLCPRESDPSRKPRDGNLDAADIILDTADAVCRATDFLENQAPEAIQGSGGDATTLNVARDLRKFGLSRQKTLELILDHWNDTKASPPWAVDDLEVKVRNAYRYNDCEIGVLSPQRDILTQGPSLSASSSGQVLSAEIPIANSSAASTGPSRSNGAIDILTFDEAINAAEEGEADFLIKGLLDANAFSVIYGAPNAGKSFAALEIAHCIATGRDFAGLQTRPGAVLYVALEGIRGVFKRLKALRTAYPKHDASRLFVARGDVDLYGGIRSQNTLIAKVLDCAERAGVPIRLLVIDTLARAIAGGDENKTQDMSLFVKRAGEIGRATGAHVCIIHHAGKDASKGARGSMALRAAADTELEVKASANDGSREIVVQKQRDHECPRPIRFRLKPIKIGTNAQLEDVMSCVVDFATSMTAVVAENDLPKKVQLALAALDVATGSGAKPASSKAWTRAINEAAGEELSSNASYSLRKRVEQAGLARQNARGFWERISTGPNITTAEQKKRRHGDVHGDDFPAIPEHHQNITKITQTKKAA